MKFSWPIKILHFEVERNNLQMDETNDKKIINRLQRENEVLSEAIQYLEDAND
jgi:hypothetical protein